MEYYIIKMGVLNEKRRNKKIFIILLNPQFKTHYIPLVNIDIHLNPY